MGSILPPCSTAKLSRHNPSAPTSLTTRSRGNLANPALNPLYVPLPPNPISSDSGSNYYMSNPTPVEPDVASVEQRDQTKPPMLTGRKASAQVLHDFEDSGCETYFFHKEVQANKQVTSVILGIKDHRIKDWYRANKAVVNALTFKDFMLQLHLHLLKERWMNSLQCEILSTTQGRKPFNDRQNSLGALNSLLVGSASHIPEQQLCNQLNVNMNSETKLECDELGVHNELVYSTWVEKVNNVDRKHLCSVEKHTRLVKDAVKRSNKVLTGPSARGNKLSSSSLSSITPATAFGILAKLTIAERALLNAHEGCTKCRHFYVTHCARDCTAAFPDAASYKPLTEAMAINVKKSRNGGKVAAVIEEAEDTEDKFVAMVGMSSSVIGDGTNSSSDEYIPPSLPQKHLFLTFFVNTPSDSDICVNTLIDDGCGTVLIRPDFANKLKLRRVPLWDKVTVSLAVDSGRVKKFVFDEYVALKLYSVDRQWQLKTVCTIITPGLCTKLILGLSFLATHSIIIDYQT